MQTVMSMLDRLGAAALRKDYPDWAEEDCVLALEAKDAVLVG
jgi:hypothetical protein